MVASPETIARVEVRGNARIPMAKVCSVLRTVAGLGLDDELVQHDIRALWESGLFDDVTVSSEPSPEGAAVVFSVHERPIVARWNVRGVSPSDPAGVRVLFRGEDQLFYPATVRAWVGLVRQEYVNQGFRSVAIETKAASRPGNQVDVDVDVTEGPRAAIATIRIEGVSKQRQKELLALIDTGGGRWNRIGASYRADWFERDRLVMSANYYDRGMLQIEIAPEQLVLSPDHTALDVSVAITEGPVYKLAELRCEGDLADTEKKCLELLGVKSGDVFSRAKLLEGITRIRALQVQKGRSDQVDPMTELDPTKHTVKLTIHIARAQK